MVVEGQYPRAVALFRGLAALRPKDPSPAYRLAEVYTLAGQYEEAIGEYRRFAARPEADPARKQRAEAEARRLEEAPAPFAETLFKPARGDRTKPSGSSTRARRTRRPSAGNRADQRAAGGAAARSRSARPLSPPRRRLRQDRRSRARAALPRRLPARAPRRQDRRHGARDARQGARARHAQRRRVVPVQGLHQRARDRARSTPLKKLRAAAGQATSSVWRTSSTTSCATSTSTSRPARTRPSASRSACCRRSSTRGRACASTAKTSACGTRQASPRARTTSSYKSHDGAKEKSVELDIKGGARAKLSW